MKTEILKVSSENPEPEIITRASELIRTGKLVAFPTETVYGLGANALDSDAVKRIFEAKGRPSNNPLIVHVASVEQAKDIVSDWNENAELLTQYFWPGPLTVILPKKDSIPNSVTGGGHTVAVRFPLHPVARELIRASGAPIAAPSANRSMRLSPTTADHVRRSLGGRIELILDGGATSMGVESTVLDLTRNPAILLRPGGVTPNEIKRVIGPIAFADSLDKQNGAPMSSPGMMKKHYAPRAPLKCLEGDLTGITRNHRFKGEKIGLLRFEGEAIPPDMNLIVIGMPQNARQYASKLYAALHSLDEAGVSRIFVEMPPDGEEWMAVKDRLKRAEAF